MISLRHMTGLAWYGAVRLLEMALRPVAFISEKLTVVNDKLALAMVGRNAEKIARREAKTSNH